VRLTGFWLPADAFVNTTPEKSPSLNTRRVRCCGGIAQPGYSARIPDAENKSPKSVQDSVGAFQCRVLYLQSPGCASRRHLGRRLGVFCNQKVIIDYDHGYVHVILRKNNPTASLKMDT
jgi:hypothetical protein